MDNSELIKLPESISICGLDVDVIYPKKLHGDYAGLFASSAPYIKVSPEHGTNKAILSCFLHELLHAIDYFYLDDYIRDEAGETGIKLLECTLFSILLKNKNKLFIENIPKTVDILGYTMHIDRSDFEDTADILTFRVSMHDELILINYEVESDKLVAQSLVCAILVGLFSRVDLEFDLSKIVVFGRGLYQVFVDNNLMKLFKEVV